MEVLMTFDEFQQRSRRTHYHGPLQEQVTIFSLGLMCEAAEAVQPIKKALRHGSLATVDLVELKDELGDVLFYMAALASVCGLSLDDIARQNIQKLQTRYPVGFEVR
jgi:NTP pyrophosphatase (non-canonical NTP hydrolase)